MTKTAVLNTRRGFTKLFSERDGLGVVWRLAIVRLFGVGLAISGHEAEIT
jgi:hypothetical protein